MVSEIHSLAAARNGTAFDRRLHRSSERDMPVGDIVHLRWGAAAPDHAYLVDVDA